MGAPLARLLVGVALLRLQHVARDAHHHAQPCNQNDG